MERKFDLIIFDLDGTLFDTKWTILKALVDFVEKEKLRKLTDEEVEGFFGPPVIKSFEKFYPHFNKQEIDELTARYRKYYMENELLKAKIYNGTKEMIVTLKERGYKVALATYKLMKCVFPLLEYNDIIKYFYSIQGSFTELDGTKADIMLRAIKECEITDLNRVCMVGDTEHDFGAARTLQVSFIGMNYAHTFDNLSKEQAEYKKLLGLCSEAIEILDLV